MPSPRKGQRWQRTPATHSEPDASLDRAAFPDHLDGWGRACPGAGPLELHEGLAEYTGVRLSGATLDRQRRLAADGLERLETDGSVIRSLAYATGPAYGLLLDRYLPGWRRRAQRAAGLDLLLAAAVGFADRNDSTVVATRGEGYGSAEVVAAEQARTQRRAARQRALRSRLLDGPVLLLPLRRVMVGFDPNRVEPLDSVGTVYEQLHLSDEWGVLEVEAGGGLIDRSWTAARVPAPPTPPAGVEQHLSGDRWTLELNPGWRIEPGVRRGDYRVVRSGPP